MNRQPSMLKLVVIGYITNFLNLIGVILKFSAYGVGIGSGLALFFYTFDLVSEFLKAF